MELKLVLLTVVKQVLLAFKKFTHGLRYGFSIRACQSVNADNTNYGERSVAQYIVIDYNQDDIGNNNTQTKPDKVSNVNIYDVTEIMVVILM